MEYFINKLFVRAKNEKCSLDKNLDISDMRFIFSVDYSYENYFTSRLAFIKFFSSTRDFSSMSLMEKIKCSEKELLCFEEGRLESDPEYIRDEIVRFKALYKTIETDYLNTKKNANQQMNSNPIESIWSVEFTKHGFDINEFYTELQLFLKYSYSEIENSLQTIESYPAWDQNLIKDYRNIIENNITVLNKIISLERIMCEKHKECKIFQYHHHFSKI